MNRSITAISGVWLHRKSTSSGRAVCRAGPACTSRQWIERPGSQASEALHGCAVRPERVLQAHLYDQRPQVPVDPGTPFPIPGTSIASSCENPLGASARAPPAERCEGRGGPMETTDTAGRRTSGSPDQLTALRAQPPSDEVFGTDRLRQDDILKVMAYVRSLKAS